MNFDKCRTVRRKVKKKKKKHFAREKRLTKRNNHTDINIYSEKNAQTSKHGAIKKRKKKQKI